ncbi:hypothetical protein [Halopseudomonas maritima]|uniref:hypothetical protein n=1 Tax=Halopseudomonas maritima TaxID=2918528 RepID=UPI001EE9D3A5|nr:hypothetical protein [Halopseudomonas maritima]UJJ31988.1 hypothetical protein HV822_02130 [Halopseudomonas maritima]
MKPTSNNTLRCIYLAFLSALLILLNGCSINAREFAWSAYQNRDPSIDQWQRVEPHTDRTLLLATFASTHYTRSNRLASDDELISADTPVLLAWIEFKAIEQPIPLYRYVIQPLKAITAEELLTQGNYITNSTNRLNNLPAKTPATVTNGAVVTDWQYCYDCFTSKPLDELTPANLASLREQMTQTVINRPLDRLIFVSDPRKAVDFKGRSDIQVYAGAEAQQQQALLAERVNELSGAIADAQSYDDQYRRFTNTEHKPLTFAYWSEQAGCPQEIANFRELRGSRRSRANTIIRRNVDYIECNTKALESYDIAPYQAAYADLQAREEMLWSRSNKQDRHRVVPPEDTIEHVLGYMDTAERDIESAYRDLETADRLDERNRQLEAWSQQNWANTLSSIQARNNSINTHYQQTQAMIRNVQRRQYARPASTSYPTAAQQTASAAAASIPAAAGHQGSPQRDTTPASDKGATTAAVDATPAAVEQAQASTENAQDTTASSAESTASATSNSAKKAPLEPPALGYTPDAKGCWNGRNTQGACLQYTTHEDDGKTYFRLTNLCNERLYMKWCANDFCGADSLSAGQSKTQYEFVTQASTMAKAVGSTMPGNDWVCAGRVSDW